jgi:hypothetical protein
MNLRVIAAIERFMEGLYDDSFRNTKELEEIATRAVQEALKEDKRQNE